MASYDAPPPMPSGVDPQQAVQAPALALIITNAAFLVIVVILFIVAPALMASIIAQIQQQQARTSQPLLVHPDQLKQGPLDYLLLLLKIVGGGLGIFGALKMRNLESYPLAMTASIVSMIPYVSPCCCLGLPIGIWSVVVLCKPEVKSAFRS